MLNEMLFLIAMLGVAAMAIWASRQGREALVVFIVLQALFANLLVLKQISLFGLNATCSDMFSVGGFLALHWIQERYGDEAATQAIHLSFGGLLFYLFCSQVQIHYTPSPSDTAHFAYSTLFTPAPRLLIASLLAYYLSQHLNRYCYRLARTSWPTASLLWVSMGCVAIAQAADTLLYAYIGLYHYIDHLPEVIFISYLIKMLCTTTLTPLLTSRHAPNKPSS